LGNCRSKRGKGEGGTGGAAHRGGKKKGQGGGYPVKGRENLSARRVAGLGKKAVRAKGDPDNDL